MGVELKITNPVAIPKTQIDDSERFPPAKRLDTLEGKTIALYWNGKQNGLDALARAKEVLSQRYNNTIRFIDVTGELGGTNRYMSEDQFDMFKREVDAAICTTADCGSCCSWMMRDICEIERIGIPAVAYTAEIFTEDAAFSTNAFGCPEAVPLIVPECFSNKTTEEINHGHVHGAGGHHH